MKDTTAPNTKIKFKPEVKSTFDKQVRDAVYGYFKSNNISFHGDHRMIIKTIVIFTVMFGSYGLILSNTLPVWAMFMLCVVSGISWAGAGMSIMHDACHSSYSSNKRVNKLLGYTMNVLGGNKSNWIIQHNMKHHTYTNIFGADEDLENGDAIRLSPYSDHKVLHRFQHIYAWFLYMLGTLSWVFIKDYKQFSALMKDANEMSRKQYNGKLAFMIVTKILYYFVMLVIPFLVLDLPFWAILLGFVTAHFVSGFILSVTFQLAHVVETTDHIHENECRPTLNSSWAEHQLRTTANFCRNNRILSWYVGGLNFQIEHHLFPNVCHVHYYKISQIVKEVAQAHGIPYNEFKTFKSAISSHYNTLKSYSRPEINSYTAAKAA